MPSMRFPIATRDRSNRRSNVSTVSEMSTTTSTHNNLRLQWLERLRPGNRTSQVSNISNASSGPKSPVSPSYQPEALASLQASLEQATQPAVPMPLHRSLSYDQTPSYSTRPNTSNAQGVHFALADIEAQERGQRTRPRRRRSARKLKWWSDDGGWDGFKGKILALIISGILLAISLALYLGLSLGAKTPNNTVNVVLILALLITGIFFCHALIRLMILATKPPSQRNLPEDFQDSALPLPRHPIPVHLPGSPITAGAPAAPKPPPPAYGLWRYSVRVAPEQLQWMRRDQAAGEGLVAPSLPTPTGVRPESAASNRPPSYMSDDGVGYVVRAEPRSTVANMTRYS
ncbi:hypothetical protein BJ508DRAFT_322532 [Ascobolus immersus RN42]|uniref:Uncharacterized protein n=1 Tax=Ascobolus immersus RN42 TaxID=1160509 RepID=A0A3N4IMR0_ASCIM|nr:hypothetical protein BJ508DRAFT_322532 [Ascobolus immersus RN42]